MTAQGTSAGSRKLAWALVVLAFLSKVSLSFSGVMPSQLGFVVFQGGIHPYFNVLLNLGLGAALLVSVYGHKEWPKLNRYHSLYATFAIGTIVILWIQHILQLLLEIETNTALALITMSTCTFLICMFGLLIPQLIGVREFVEGVARICLVICALSLLLLFAGAPAMWKGSRFIGIFKHIPYMVTASTVGFLFTLQLWDEAAPLLGKAKFALSQLIFLYCMWLTGTRSAPLAAMMGLVVFFLAYQSTSRGFRMARLLTVWLGIVGVVLFGAMALEYGTDLATGKVALGKRAPQNGVSDRMEEVSRGLDMLEKSPHVGLGLLSKFSNSDSEEVVDSYNSFQDPHNLFISSSVVGGWPFGLWVLAGFVGLGVGSIALIRRREKPGLTIGVYLFSHMPILAIYHMHLSLGGLADRFYWLSFGYLALLLGRVNSPQFSDSEH
ncbi:MAG: O-antigen ligase family protein [Bdellovibrionota bacterium]